MSYRSLAVAPILILAAPALAGEDVGFVETPAWVEPLYDGGIAESRDNVPLYDRQIRFEDGVVTRYTDIAYRLDTTQLDDGTHSVLVRATDGAETQGLLTTTRAVWTSS